MTKRKEKDNVSKPLWVLFAILTIVNIYLWGTTGITWHDDIQVFNYWLIPTMLAQLEIIYMLMLKGSKEGWETCKLVSFFGTTFLQVATMALSIISFTIYLYGILIVVGLTIFVMANKQLAYIMRGKNG